MGTETEGGRDAEGGGAEPAAALPAPPPRRTSLHTSTEPKTTCSPSKKLSPMRMTVAPPVVQPSLGLMALMQGAAVGGGSREVVRRGGVEPWGRGWGWRDRRTPCVEMGWGRHGGTEGRGGGMVL